MIARIAVLVLGALPLRAQTIDPTADGSSYTVQDSYTIQDFMPMAVGNSWTFEHLYMDQRHFYDPDHTENLHLTDSIHHGSGYFPTWDASDKRLTISIVRTEVHDGNTYYVFSATLPSGSWPPAPGFTESSTTKLLLGMKLRWDGDTIMMWDGVSAVELLRFPALPSNSDLRVEDTAYNASIDGQSYPVSTYSRLSRLNDIPEIGFAFSSHGFGSGIGFVGGFGVIGTTLSSDRIDIDVGPPFWNELFGVEATLVVDGDGGSRDSSDISDSQETITIDRSDLRYWQRRGRRSTSLTNSSWGAVKETD